MINWIGWVATGVFAVSYFCKQPKMLRMVQAVAALMWVTYGFLIGAMPVVVANVIVALAAVYSSFTPGRNSPTA
jgi:uncharacterized protein with PQ loop repeat